MPKHPKKNIPPKHPPSQSEYPRSENLPSEHPYAEHPPQQSPYVRSLQQLPNRPPPQYSNRPPLQPSPFESSALVHSSPIPGAYPSSDKHSNGSSTDLTGTESNPRRKDLTGTTHRHSDSIRHSDRLAESEEEITVATNQQVDSKRHSDRPAHKGKEEKSTKTSDTRKSHTKGPSPSTMMSMWTRKPRSKPKLKIDHTMEKQGEKSTGGRSKVESAKPPRNNRNTGGKAAETIEPSRDTQSPEHRITKVTESSQGNQSTQQMIAREWDYYAILGCTIDDNTKTIIRKHAKKQRKLYDEIYASNSLSEQRKAEIFAEGELLDKAVWVLEDEAARKQYDEVYKTRR